MPEGKAGNSVYVHLRDIAGYWVQALVQTTEKNRSELSVRSLSINDFSPLHKTVH